MSVNMLLLELIHLAEIERANIAIIGESHAGKSTLFTLIRKNLGSNDYSFIDEAVTSASVECVQEHSRLGSRVVFTENCTDVFALAARFNALGGTTLVFHVSRKDTRLLMDRVTKIKGSKDRLKISEMPDRAPIDFTPEKEVFPEQE